MTDFTQKTIGVVGLGLIGGSFCKTIRKQLGVACLGLDADLDTVEKAIAKGAIEEAMTTDTLDRCDITIVALHPIQTIDFLKQYAKCFKKGSIVMDVCGVKSTVISAVEEALAEHGVSFIGTHPMAGREFSGFDYALDTLFDHASFIITPTARTPQADLETVASLAEQLQFERVVIATPADHDKIIAFTSQLAHVVSNAYIKSPTALYQLGFSAGSFLDLTRVAKLNEDMWTDLFLMNQEPLLHELDTIISHLQEYREAICSADHDHLRELLREGRILKEKSMEMMG